MTARAAIKAVLGVVCLLVCLAYGAAAAAQQGGATLSGTVTEVSGAAVANAKVSVKNLATGQASDVTTNAAGTYSVPNLPPGDYEVSVSAGGFAAKTARVTIGTDVARQAMDVVLARAASQAPSLSDLGFPAAQTQGSAQEQARLDKRSHMLKIHQRLGLITAVPLAATIIASTRAGGRQSTSTGRQVHAALGAATAGLYFTTASFAIFAPKAPGTQVRGPIRVHRALAWIHGTGMILTPVLGALAYRQRSRGERVHGIANYHGPAGVVTLGAYAAAIMSVSVKF